VAAVTTAAGTATCTYSCYNTTTAVVLCAMYFSNSTHCIQHLLAGACCPRVCETGVSAIDTLILLAEYIDLTGIREAKEPENDMEAQNYTSGTVLISRLLL
jgi:dissimilatory sulfite reductase (desulfoviridin) alpha/beta subunit